MQPPTGCWRVGNDRQLRVRKPDPIHAHGPHPVCSHSTQGSSAGHHARRLVAVVDGAATPTYTALPVSGLLAVFLRN